MTIAALTIACIALVLASTVFVACVWFVVSGTRAIGTAVAVDMALQRLQDAQETAKASEVGE